MATLGEFLSPEAGQERRKWLNETLGYYLPPELRGIVGLGAELNPVTNMERAGTAAQRVADPSLGGWDRMAAAGDMAVNMGAVLAPVAGAKLAGTAGVDAIVEALTAASPMKGAVDDFMVDEFGGVGFRAFHGSPHDFDRFSLDKIGTGEGAQAYGHGLYFADSEDVARSYRDRLTMPRDQYGQVIGNPRQYYRTKVDGVDARGGGQDFWEVAEQIAHKGMTYDEYLADLIDKSTWSDSPLVQERFRKEIERAQRFAPDLRGKSITYEPPVGNMYEVQINADPNDFLDWDKPLSEQPKALDALRPVIGNVSSPAYGVKAAIDDASKYLGYADDPRRAEDLLREAGIPGIRYLDAGSRGAGDGSRNYVVFDDKLIEILRKYGLAGAVPLGALLGQSQDPMGSYLEAQ